MPRQLTRRSVFSYCGRLLGHFPVCGWLRDAAAFVKRTVNRLTSSWDEVAVDEQLTGFLKNLQAELVTTILLAEDGM